MNRQGYGHGDILFIPAKIPADAKRIARRVLATGELTGHAHRLLEHADVEVYEDAQGTLWIRVGPGGAPVTHEEHGERVVERYDHAEHPGEFRIGRQQEYDHFAQEARGVRD